MDYSYENIYAGYVKFCKMVDVPALPFDKWMTARETDRHKESPATAFLKQNQSQNNDPFDRSETLTQKAYDYHFETK